MDRLPKTNSEANGLAGDRPGSDHLRRPMLLGTAILALTVLAYLPAMRGTFLWDDDRHFSENPFMHGSLATLWSEHGFYYPLTSTTFWLARRLWGLNPVPYHQLNILLHAVDAVLLWQLLRRLRVRSAWLAGGLFALHPVNVQSVAWITELKNVQSGLFYLISLHAWLGYREGRGAVPYGAALGCFVLAVLSKTSTVTLPLALIVIQLWRREAFSRRVVQELSPFFAISLAAGLATVLMHRATLAVGAEWDETAAQRLVLAGRCVWFYLFKLLVPLNLVFVYPRWQIDAARLTQWLPVAALATLAIVLWPGRKSWSRASLLAGTYYVASLLPVLNLFRMYYTRYSYAADHWQYLAAMGGVAWIAGGLAWLTDRIGRRRQQIFPLLSFALLTAAGGLTWGRSHVYQSQETLWRDTIARNPDAIISYNVLGAACVKEGRYEDAISVLDDGLALRPGDATLLTIRGAALLYLSRPREAMIDLQEALRTMPDDTEILNNIGLAHAQMGELEQAARTFRRVMELDPFFAEACFNLAQALADAGRRGEALALLEQAVARLPANAQLRDLRVRLLEPSK